MHSWIRHRGSRSSHAEDGVKEKERSRAKLTQHLLNGEGMRHLFRGLMQNRVTQGYGVHNNADYTHMLIITR